MRRVCTSSLETRVRARVEDGSWPVQCQRYNASDIQDLVCNRGAEESLDTELLPAPGKIDVARKTSRVCLVLYNRRVSSAKMSSLA